MSGMKNAMNCWRARPQRRAISMATALAMIAAAHSAEARTPPSQDPFYQYTGSTPLADIAPGTVLKTRTVPYHILGLPLPLKTTQLLYRATGSLGQPTVNVTSVVRPPAGSGPQKLVSYQSFYDTLNPDDEPSYAISGGLTLGGLIPNIESLLLMPLLTQGYSLVIPDFEGQQADYVSGRESGTNTLDSLRATFNSPEVGLPADTQAVLIGYSGGSIGTEWAAELAPTYAPDVAKRIIGASMGGVPAYLMHNLRYVSGTVWWAGIMVAALIGTGHGYQVDLSPYLSDLGNFVVQRMQKASIINILGQYPFLSWQAIAKPEYQAPEKVPPLVEITNKLIMSTGGTPSAPLLIYQGTLGELNGTPGNQPGIGPGDGVMVAGDVRSVAREYCARGVTVKYVEVPLEHVSTAIVGWLPDTLAWINDRFVGRPAPQNCSKIAVGNSIAPTPMPAAP